MVIKVAFVGKLHFSSNKTYEPTGTPECRFSLSKSLTQTGMDLIWDLIMSKSMVGGHYVGLDELFQLHQMFIIMKDGFMVRYGGKKK